MNIHFTTRLYKDIGCDETHCVLFLVVKLIKPPFHSAGTCERALSLVFVGECVPALYLGLLYRTLDIKLNVP